MTYRKLSEDDVIEIINLINERKLLAAKQMLIGLKEYEEESKDNLHKEGAG